MCVRTPYRWRVAESLEDWNSEFWSYFRWGLHLFHVPRPKFECKLQVKECRTQNINHVSGPAGYINPTMDVKTTVGLPRVVALRLGTSLKSKPLSSETFLEAQPAAAGFGPRIWCLEAREAMPLSNQNSFLRGDPCEHPEKK